MARRGEKRRRSTCALRRLIDDLRLEILMPLDPSRNRAVAFLWLFCRACCKLLFFFFIYFSIFLRLTPQIGNMRGRTLTCPKPASDSRASWKAKAFAASCQLIHINGANGFIQSSAWMIQVCTQIIITIHSNSHSAQINQVAKRSCQLIANTYGYYLHSIYSIMHSLFIIHLSAMSWLCSSNVSPYCIDAFI